MSEDGTNPAAAPPLVSVVVRSMGRPHLAQALDSLARQDHPALEVIVVDATGGAHPPLPQLPWRNGHALRMASAGRRLTRPHAANAGLDDARGEWLAFLDDDDTCEPTHISALVAAAAAHPHALVVYGQGRLLDAEGRVEALFGKPFNRALMHFGPLFYWQAALIRMRVRDLGCRFDPEFDVCEDRDFIAQVAEHGDFAFVPLATFNFRPDLGTSGTGRGGNRVESRCQVFDARYRAKWGGVGAYHVARVARRCRSGVRAFMSGDVDGAERWFQLALRDYPGDPNALNGLARVALARADRAAALRYAEAAVAARPDEAEYRHTLLLASSAPEAPAPPRRTAPCSCGSGQRYKDCCGRLVASAAASRGEAPGAAAMPAAPDARAASLHEAAPSAAPVLGKATAAMLRGDLQAASALLEPWLARDPRDAPVALLAAQCALVQDDVERAYRHLAAGEPPVVDAPFCGLLAACCERLFADACRATLWPRVQAVRARCASRAAPEAVATHAVMSRVHVAIGPADGSIDLVAALQSHASVVAIASPEEWGRAAADASRSTLVVSDILPELDRWLDAAFPARLVVRATRDDLHGLMERLVEIDEREARVQIDLTLPCAAGVAHIGDALLEYPWLPGGWTQARPPDRPNGDDAPSIGMPAGDLPGVPHACDPAVWRALLAVGARVRLLAHPALRGALADDAGIEWRPVSDPTLPEVVVYRRKRYEPGASDLGVLSAMAQGKAVIVFEGSLAAAELVDNGVTGFIVRSEGDAVALGAELLRDAQRRRAIGTAARQEALLLAREQQERAAAFYCGVRR